MWMTSSKYFTGNIAFFTENTAWLGYGGCAGFLLKPSEARAICRSRHLRFL